MSPQPRRGRGRNATKQADPEPPEVDEDEVEDEDEAPKRQRDTSPLPSGEDLYNAKFVDGLTWQEIRDQIDARIRSPKGLALIAEYVIEEGLEDDHPEFAAISGSDKRIADQIVEWHDSGQGFSLLAARTGLNQGEVRDIYEEAGGENTGRVGGRRYGGGRSVGKAAAEEAEAEAEAEAPKPKNSRRRGAKADESETEAEAPKPSRSRGRQRAATGDGDTTAKTSKRGRSRTPSK
jgi:hypothetical protein